MELAPIARTYEDLKQAKARRKDLKAQLKEEVVRHPAYEGAHKELTDAKGKMKLITTEALGTSGLESDIENINVEVKELQAVLDDLVANAIAEGTVKNGQEVDLGGLVVTARVRVNLKQMSLNL